LDHSFEIGNIVIIDYDRGDRVYRHVGMVSALNNERVTIVGSWDVDKNSYRFASGIDIKTIKSVEFITTT